MKKKLNATYVTKLASRSPEAGFILKNIPGPAAASEESWRV